jgi:hypothetical protein
MDFYELDREPSESVYKFIRRNIEVGVFKQKARAMHYHFSRKTGLVFIPKDGVAVFLLEAK